VGATDMVANMPEQPSLIPPHGGYRKLRSFQAAEVVYDAAVIFCDRFIDKRSRTHDQMVQAGRSGVQNIAEGSVASATSKKTELKLTNVARASLEELLLDCQDFLRQHGLRQWAKDSPEAMAVRRRYLSDASDGSDKSDVSQAFDPYGIRTASAEVAANTLICLINQASYLLGRQIRALEQQFIEEGGFTERLYSIRSKHRAGTLGTANQRSCSPPACPCCSKPMVQRTARKGPQVGQPFWGCSAYPECTGTRPVEKTEKSDRSEASDVSDQAPPRTS
jgi:restriction system protein